MMALYFLSPPCPDILVLEPLEGFEQNSTSLSMGVAFKNDLSNSGLDPVCRQTPLSQNPPGKRVQIRIPRSAPELLSETSQINDREGYLWDN